MNIDKNKQECQFVIFGACIRGISIAEELKKEGKTVSYFCDHDKNKQDKIYYSGIECISTSKLATLKNVVVIISTQKNIAKIQHELAEQNIKSYSLYEFYFQEHVEELSELDELLYDEASKNTLRGILTAGIYGDFSGIREVFSHDQYLTIPEFCDISPTEVVIDCGAYVGDFLERYIFNRTGVFGKYYACEPSDKQFTALKSRRKRLLEEWALEDEQIELLLSGIGHKEYKTTFSNEGASMNALTLSTEAMDIEDGIQVRTIDGITNDRVDLIKMDIEGFEMNALQGAERTIKQYHPKLAISIYHKPEHLFEAALYLKALVPEYKMAIRHHSMTLNETVLYCWI